MKNIVLVGFMGSGKSSVGKALAKKNGFYFLDSDVLIESFENEKVRAIFESKGEDYFRKQEILTFDWFCDNVQKAVIATGGGMPMVVKDMKRAGLVIYLNIGFDSLLERLKAEEFDKRPLFSNIEFARALYEKRKIRYEEVADVVIDASLPIDDIVEKILEEVV